MWPIESMVRLLQGREALLHAAEEDDRPWLENLQLGAEGLVLLLQVHDRGLAEDQAVDGRGGRRGRGVRGVRVAARARGCPAVREARSRARGGAEASVDGLETERVHFGWWEKSGEDR